MNDYSSMTKADLLKEIGVLSERVVKAEQYIRPEPRSVPEANALAACIRGLDALVESDGPRRTDSWSIASIPTSRNPHVGRILRALADKYSVQLIEVRTEPCSRSHVDQIDPGFLTSAITQAVRS